MIISSIARCVTAKFQMPTGDSLTRAAVRRASSQLAALVATHEGEQDSDSPSAGKEELGATPRPVGVVEEKEEAEPAQHSGAEHTPHPFVK